MTSESVASKQAEFAGNLRGLLLILLPLLMGLAWWLSQQLKPEIQARKSYLSSPAVAGLGIGEIQLGVASLSQIEQRFGKADEHTRAESTITRCLDGNCTDTPLQSTHLRYIKEGMWFEFEGPQAQAESELKLERLGVDCPQAACAFSGQTDKGLKLHDTRQRLRELYGAPLRNVHNSWLVFYREGIGFGLEAPKDKKFNLESRVSSIQILKKDSDRLK